MIDQRPATSERRSAIYIFERGAFLRFGGHHILPAFPLVMSRVVASVFSWQYEKRDVGVTGSQGSRVQAGNQGVRGSGMQAQRSAVRVRVRYPGT